MNGVKKLIGCQSIRTDQSVHPSITFHIFATNVKALSYCVSLICKSGMKWIGYLNGLLPTSPHRATILDYVDINNSRSWYSKFSERIYNIFSSLLVLGVDEKD